MLAELRGMVKSLDAILSSLDPALLHTSDAVQVLDAATAVAQRADAIKALVASRAAEAGQWASQGHRSPEEWLAKKTGTSYGQAAGTLNASEKLAELPELGGAVRNGELSGPQLNELASAATPDNERQLVEASKRQSFKQLRRTCANEKASQRSTERDEARHERIHTERFYRSRTDDDGAYCFEGKATAAVGARIEAALDAEADTVFKQAHVQGRHESSAAYRLDALVNLICGGGARVDLERAEVADDHGTAHRERRSFGDSLGGAAAAQHLIEARLRDQRRYPLLPLPGPDRRQRARGEAEGRNPEEERREDAQVLPEQRGLDPGHGAPCMRVPRRATPISPNSAAGTKKRAYHSS